jgi:endo-alpha-1,4-polygalactosaminidase (GH114 family)
LGGVSSFTAPVRFYYDTDYEPNRAYVGPNFPLLVIDPGANLTPQRSKAQGVQTVLAYTSAIEMAKDSRFLQKAKDAGIGILGTNPDWGSLFMDMTNPDWAEFYCSAIVGDAVRRGFDGIILDTYDMSVDIFNAGLHDDLDHMIECMAELVLLVRREFPGLIVVPNRGFEQWETSKEFRVAIDGMLVESYRTGGDFKWMDKRIKKVTRAGKPVLAVEYTRDLPTAKRITKENKAMGIPTLVCASRDITRPKVVWYPGAGKAT